MEPHLIDALAPGRMGVEFGFEVVGVLGGAQSRLRAVFRTLAHEFGIAPLRVAAFEPRGAARDRWYRRCSP